MLVTATVLAFFIVRVTGYPLLSRHDARVGAYVLDTIQNGNWIVQKNAAGEVAAKPPLLTWCAVLPTLLVGRISLPAIYFPAAAALCATALILLAAGTKRYGWRPGFFAAFAYVVSPAGYSLIATARYDSLLALMSILCALAAFRAWVKGSGWTWFWLAGAVGTLAKGPLALVLGAAGLLAFFWEPRSGSRVPFRGNHLPGVLLFLLIAGGWFLLAYAQLGQALTHKMIGRELVGHAFGEEDLSSRLGFLRPSRDFLTDFAPWSLAVLFSFWRVLKRPDADPTNRRFERFLVCASLVGLIIFSVAGHRKSRLIIPLFPFVALLAGREVARLVTRWSDRAVLRLAALVAVVVAIGIFVRAHVLLRDHSRVEETLAARQVARMIPERFGADAPLTYVDAPFALQFYLNSLRPPVSVERAASLLRGSAAAWVVVHDVAGLQKALGPDTNSLHEVLRWPPAGEPVISILGNRPLPITNQPVAMLLGPLRLEARSVHLEHPRINYRRGIEMDVLGSAAQGRLRIENQGLSPQMVRLRRLDQASTVAPTQIQSNLPPGAVWSLPEPAVHPRRRMGPDNQSSGRDQPATVRDDLSQSPATRQAAPSRPS